MQGTPAAAATSASSSLAQCDPLACGFCQAMPREPAQGEGWSEIFIDAGQAGACSGAAESLECGHSVLLIPGLGSATEYKTLLAEATTCAASVKAGRAVSVTPGALSVGLACRLEQPCAPHCSPGRVRMPVAGLRPAVQKTCDELLLRALEFVDKAVPSLNSILFGQSPAAALRAEGEFARSSLLSFTHNEPAINVYTAGGDFSPHRDLQALTVLMPLVDAAGFEGGGTAFWSSANTASGPPMALPDVDPSRPPSLLLAPPAGTAMLWGGDLMHAGQPVTAGQRAVFVASFSQRSSGSENSAAAAHQHHSSAGVGDREAGDASGGGSVERLRVDALDRKRLEEWYS